MMPGVVAGFPLKTSQAAVTSANSSTRYGFIRGSIYWPDLGSISPVGAVAIPAGQPSPGGQAEILQLVWYSAADVSYGNKLELMIRGAYASISSLPFTTLNIDGRLFNKSTAQMDYGDDFRSVLWDTALNPLPVGSRNINFQ